MNNNNESIGLRVLSVSPSHTESNVNVNSSIDVTFSSDINPITLSKNIVVFEDYNKIYKDISSLKDYSKFSVVKGSISYKDRVLVYTPDKPFNINSSYILMLNDQIADIVGNHLVQKLVSVFYTEKVASYPRCEITSPKYGLISESIPEFKWINQKSPSYVFQVAKNNSFENLILNDVIPGNEFEDEINYVPSFDAYEGIYYIRIKSENGEWSDTHQIFIKPVTDSVIAQEDTPEILSYDNFLDNIKEPLVILEQFPNPNSINNSLKTNMIYIKLQGNIEESRIDFDDCYIYAESLDEDHEEYTHQNIQGYWSRVYDMYHDCTYIIFTFTNYSEETEEETNTDPIQEPTPNSENTPTIEPIPESTPESTPNSENTQSEEITPVIEPETTPITEPTETSETTTENVENNESYEP